MPRDNDRHNDSRGRRDRADGGKGRSGKPRGPDKKFAKRGFGGKTSDGERGERPRFSRDDRPRDAATGRSAIGPRRWRRREAQLQAPR